MGWLTPKLNQSSFIKTTTSGINSTFYSSHDRNIFSLFFSLFFFWMIYLPFNVEMIADSWNKRKSLTNIDNLFVLIECLCCFALFCFVILTYECSWNVRLVTRFIFPTNWHWSILLLFKFNIQFKLVRWRQFWPQLWNGFPIILFLKLDMNSHSLFYSNLRFWYYDISFFSYFSKKLARSR